MCFPGTGKCGMGVLEERPLPSLPSASAVSCRERECAVGAGCPEFTFWPSFICRVTMVCDSSLSIPGPLTANPNQRHIMHCHDTMHLRVNGMLCAAHACPEQSWYSAVDEFLSLPLERSASLKSTGPHRLGFSQAQQDTHLPSSLPFQKRLLHWIKQK